MWARAAAARLDSPLLAPLRGGRPTLVAGSTWPADERPLLAAWRGIRERHPETRLIIAPHEPTAEHLAPIERWCERESITCARLGASDAPEADVVLVDRVGVLGDLYALADVAFVGGGFHAAGLHSVLEPAAFGAPVVFGPRHAGSRDAGLLLAARAAATAHDTTSLEASLEAWLDDPAARRAAGDAAREVVRAGLGAAERSYALVAAADALSVAPLRARRAAAGLAMGALADCGRCRKNPCTRCTPSSFTVSNSSARSTPSAITIALWSLAKRTIVSTRFCLMKFVSMR